jgi:hypothetical protein
MINIISTFYISKYSSPLDSLRSKELDTSLLNNLKSPFVEKIHLFVDDNEALDRLNNLSNNSDKIVVIEVGKKPKYLDFFKYIIVNLKDKICMIMNSDIFLFECDNNLINNLKNKKNLYALTRYEDDMSHGLIDCYGGSHDCYIFNSSFISETILSNEHVNFYQNIPGIESHVIKALCDEGLTAYNPCFQIKIVHLHKSELRKYSNGWIGLHKCGDWDFHKQSCWWVPPIKL